MYNHADFDKVMELLDEIEWETLLNGSDVDLYSLRQPFIEIMYERCWNYV